MDHKAILKVLPHRYPFLLVDRVIDAHRTEGGSRVGQTVTALKNVTFNEPFFNGHFPGEPVMPGVLIIEAMAQAGALAHHRPDDELLNFMIGSVQEAKFRKKVVPGDQLIMKAEVIQGRNSRHKIEIKTYVKEDLVAQATFLAVSSSRKDGL